MQLTRDGSHLTTPPGCLPPAGGVVQLTRDGSHLTTPPGCLPPAGGAVQLTRDVIFRTMTNRNQTDTNEMTTTETNLQTVFYPAKSTNI